MKNLPKYLAEIITAVGEALRGDKIEVGAYVVALASIEAVTRFGMFYLKLAAGVV